MAIPHPKKAKYLYSTQNGIVCINTELKRRMCPWMVPCNKIDASDIMDDPAVTMVYSDGYSSKDAEAEVAAAEVDEEALATADDNFRALRLQVMSSEDKAELRQIGADIGQELVKTMGVPKMRTKLLERIDKIQAAA